MHTHKLVTMIMTACVQDVSLSVNLSMYISKRVYTYKLVRLYLSLAVVCIHE